MVSPNRPNVLFINTDQLRADFLSCYGFPVETSPNIDRLAREGMRFDSTFCQSPICVPSRYSLSTGLYPSSHCAYTNRHAPYPTTRSLLEDFNENGYHTVTIGKLHHNPPDANFGFEEVHLHDGTFRARRKYSVYSKWLKEQGIDEDKLAYPPDIDSNPEKRPYKDTIHWGRCQLPDEYCESTFLSDYASDYVEEYDRDKPVFMYLSYVAPHSPYHPPEPYDTMFSPEDMPVPPRESEEQLDQKADVTRHRKDNKKPDEAEQIPDDIIADIRAHYAGLTRHLDENVGRAIRAFRARFGDDSIIVFTSDHGDLLGEHHACEKHQPYEAAVHIPHIVCWPGHVPEGTVTDALTEQIDMYPTVLGMVGARWDEDSVSGKDRSKAILDGEVDGEDFVFSENHQLPLARYTAMARSKTGKLIMYMMPGEEEPEFEYYDLSNDPHELNNAVEDPDLADTVQEHREALLKWFCRRSTDITPA